MEPIAIVLTGIFAVAVVVASVMFLDVVVRLPHTGGPRMTEPTMTEHSTEETLFGEPIAKDPDSLDDFPDLIEHEVMNDTRDQLEKAILDAEPLLLLADSDVQKNSGPYNLSALHSFTEYKLDDNIRFIDIDTGTTDIFIVPRDIVMDGSTPPVKLSPCSEQMLVEYAASLQEQYRGSMPYSGSIEHIPTLIRRERLYGMSEGLSEGSALSTI